MIAPTEDQVQRSPAAVVRIATGIDIELVAPIDAEDSPVTARLRRGGGLDHICLAVDDVGVSLDEERDRGAMVVCPPVHAVTFERTIAFVYRRSGLLVEPMNRAPRRVEGCASSQLFARTYATLIGRSISTDCSSVLPS